MKNLIDNIQPVILAGGFGTRLWPLSRKNHPKQFLSLVGKQSLLEQAMIRLKEARLNSPVVVCNQAHESIAQEQCRRVNVVPKKILLEPIPLGTAGAIALAAIREVSVGEGSLMLVMPVDSYFEDVEQFRCVVNATAGFAQQGKIVMFGIPPRFADTNYGYIRVGHLTKHGVSAVLSFHEKPTFESAQSYIDSNEYLWNSGVYLFRPQEYLNELNSFRPDIHDICYTLAESGFEDSNFVRFANNSLNCPVESADRAVMERTRKTIVKSCDFSWVDLGSWQSLFESQNHNSDGNAIFGNVISINTRDSYLFANNRLVSSVGISDAIVVETDDAVLVANKNNIHEVEALTEQLQKQQIDETKSCASVERPWGRADTLFFGDGYLVKRLTVNPGDSLSLQKHKHRSESWTVANGRAEVVCGDRTFTLCEGESVNIPVGIQHRLSNLNSAKLEIIEVQLGSYLDDNDIERIEDRYNRI